MPRGEPGGQGCINNTPTLRDGMEGAKFAQSPVSPAVLPCEARGEDGECPENISVGGGLEEGKLHVRNTTMRSDSGLGSSASELGFHRTKDN